MLTMKQQNAVAGLAEQAALAMGITAGIANGDIVEPVTNYTKRAGFVITTGETQKQAVERAEQVVESIRIETVPVKC